MFFIISGQSRHCFQSLSVIGYCISPIHFTQKTKAKTPPACGASLFPSFKSMRLIIKMGNQKGNWPTKMRVQQRNRKWKHWERNLNGTQMESWPHRADVDAAAIGEAVSTQRTQWRWRWSCGRTWGKWFWGKGQSCARGSDAGKNFLLKDFLEILHTIQRAKDKMSKADPNFESRTNGQGMEARSVRSKFIGQQ